MTNAEAIETLRANYPDACFEQLREAVDAAIDALKAQDGAGDTISRQAAIDALIEWYGGEPTDIGAFENIIEKLPSAEPKWIPVTERLPEEWWPVLGLIQFCDEKEPPAQQVLWYLGNGHWRETWRGDMIESAVTHWMPLPEPPKEG